MWIRTRDTTINESVYKKYKEYYDTYVMKYGARECDPFPPDIETLLTKERAEIDKLHEKLNPSQLKLVDNDMINVQQLTLDNPNKVNAKLRQFLHDIGNEDEVPTSASAAHPPPPHDSLSSQWDQAPPLVASAPPMDDLQYAPPPYPPPPYPPPPLVASAPPMDPQYPSPSYPPPYTPPYPPPPSYAQPPPHAPPPSWKYAPPPPHAPPPSYAPPPPHAPPPSWKYAPPPPYPPPPSQYAPPPPPSYAPPLPPGWRVTKDPSTGNTLWIGPNNLTSYSPP